MSTHIIRPCRLKGLKIGDWISFEIGSISYAVITGRPKYFPGDRPGQSVRVYDIDVEDSCGIRYYAARDSWIELPIDLSIITLILDEHEQAMLALRFL